MRNEKFSALDPILGFLGPSAVRISLMYQIEGRFGPTSRLLVGAAVASRLDGEMKRFRRTLIRGVLLGPFDGDATEVVRRGAQRLERSVLFRCQALRWLEKLRWHNRLWFGFCLAFTFGGPA